MSGKLNFKALSPLCAISLIGLLLGAGCQNTDPAPILRSSSTNGSTSKSEDVGSASGNTGKGSTSSKTTKKPVEDKVVNKDPAGGTPPAETEVPTALSEAKQTEIKGLFTGAWATPCIKVENPQVAGQFFSYIETWTLLADGNIESRSQDFDGATCTTPFPGYENYVMFIGKPVGLKEIGAGHFYIEMNLSKALDNTGKLIDSTAKDLVMIKFETGSMTVDYMQDLTATTLSANAVKFTKK